MSVKGIASFTLARKLKEVKRETQDLEYGMFCKVGIQQETGSTSSGGLGQSGRGEKFNFGGMQG